MSDHHHYEELCALIAVGDVRDISDHDLTDWSKHCQICSQCQALVSELHSIGQLLWLASEGRSCSSPPPGMTERFMDRAEREGIRFKAREEIRPSRGLLWWAITATAALLAVLAIDLLQYNAHTHPQNIRSSSAASSPHNGAKEPSVLALQNDTLRDQLRVARNREEELIQKLAAQRKALDATQQEEEQLNSRIAQIERDSNDLRNKDALKTATLAELQGEVERLRAEHDANRNASVAEEAELASLRAKVSKLTDQLSKQRRLDAATKLAQDLIVARNLHVFTVYDANENGGRDRAFGRIFYAEGEKLVFYAYDLPQAGTPETHVSFYVWGEKTGIKESAKNLGVFRSDEPDDARWVLKFDDAKVLTQINSVFVTAEPDKGRAAQPTGKRFLSTRLDVRTTRP